MSLNLDSSPVHTKKIEQSETLSKIKIFYLKYSHSINQSCC